MLAAQFRLVRQTRYSLELNDCAFSLVNAVTGQYARCFIPSFCKL